MQHQMTGVSVFILHLGESLALFATVLLGMLSLIYGLQWLNYRLTREAGESFTVWSDRRPRQHHFWSSGDTED